jgi:hypothetical protein
MERRVCRLKAECEKVAREKRKVEDKLQTIMVQLGLLQSMMLSPIFKRVCAVLECGDDVSAIVYEYLGVTFCGSHYTHYPQTMKECLSCALKTKSSITAREIYKFKGPLTSHVGNANRLIRMHELDAESQLHFEETLLPRNTHVVYDCNDPDEKLCVFHLLHDDSITTFYIVSLGGPGPRLTEPEVSFCRRDEQSV